MVFTKSLRLALGLAKGSTLRLVGSGLKFCKEDLNMAAINFSPLQNLEWLYNYTGHLTNAVFLNLYVVTRFSISKQQIKCIYVTNSVEKKGHVIHKTTVVI